VQLLRKSNITHWLAGYRCIRPSATRAKTNWLTNACGTATAVNSLDEAQNSGSTEYPRRTVSSDEAVSRIARGCRMKSRMVKELDLSESNHGCGLNALSQGKHPKRS
jgi:hypothetical protein